MVTTITLYLMLNNQFVGDSQQLRAIETQIVQAFREQPVQFKTVEYQDNSAETSAALEKDLAAHKTARSVILVSGSHGFHFINQFMSGKRVTEFLEQNPDKKPVVLWVGHQDPGLMKQADLFNIIALPKHVVEDKPDLVRKFGQRLVAMEAVPNTLQLKNLELALAEWNSRNDISHQEIISIPKEGAIGVFLGGSAPKPEGDYLHETLEVIYQRGLRFGQLAKQTNKKLYIVNGPRTGKFYSESPDLKDPIIRQYNKETGDWISFGELTDEQGRITANGMATMPEGQKQAVGLTLAHAHDAPLDPETTEFMRGVIASGLDEGRYQVFDFKMTPGKPTKSAYIPVIAVLYQAKGNSIACYSGESISYAEIGYFIPRTYAFHMAAMNSGHEAALRRFSQELHMVGVLDLNKPIEGQSIDLVKKQRSVQNGSQQDAARVASFLAPILEPVLKYKEKAQPSEQATSMFFSWPSSRQITYALVGGAVAAAGVFFWYRYSQTNNPSSAKSAPVPKTMSLSNVRNRGVLDNRTS